MKRTAITLAMLALVLGLAAPAQAAPVLPKAWNCTVANGTTYNCKGSFTVKAGASHSQYLWATKVCKQHLVDQITAMGGTPVDVNSGAKLVKGRTWRCGAFWTFTIPA